MADAFVVNHPELSERHQHEAQKRYLFLCGD